MAFDSTNVTKLPKPPISGDANFDEKADVFLPALVVFSDELDKYRDDLITYVEGQTTGLDTKVTAADASATAAANSASTAATKATEAATSATTAATKATESSNSAAAALASKNAAATSATSASTSASTASTAAGTASTKASEASASATLAGTKAGEAASSAGSASSSADTATTKAAEATTSASTAATHSSNAYASAAAAAGSATTASTKASEASASAATATQKALDATNSANYVAGIATALAPHVDNKANPHDVTKVQIGLGNVTDDAQIPKAIGETKGDLIGFSASGTPVRFPVGINGKVLTADDTSPLGIIWKEATGGFKQVFVTGDYTASSLDLVEVNTLAEDSTITLPASGMVEVYDAGGNCAVNNITVKDASNNVLASLDVNYGDILFRYNTITSSWDIQNLSAKNGLIAPVTLSNEAIPVTASNNYVGEAVAGQTVITPGFTWRTSWTGIVLYIDGVKQAPGSYTINSIGGGLSSQVTLSEALLGGETIDFTTLDISSVPSIQGIVDKLALQSTQITNAGFGVWSNGTLESAVSSVDLLGGTGNFETDADVAAWTVLNGATVSRDTATFVNGSSSLKITNAGATAGGVTRAVSTIVGHVYKLVSYANIGTAETCQLRAGTTLGGYDVGFVTSLTSGFVRLEMTFEAVGTTTYVTVQTGRIVSGGVHYHDSVTIYDMGVNIITNGTFNSNTTGWTFVNNAPSIVAGGINGNCLSMAHVSGGYAYYPLTGLTVGKLYRVCGWFKDGTGLAGALGVSSTLGQTREILDIRFSSAPSLAGWTFYSGIFEANNTTLYANLVGGAVGTTCLYDFITITEVTVGCVDFNTKSCDLWTKDNTAQCWRETIDTKEGSLYALRVYNGAVYWSDGNRAAKPEFYKKYAGRAASLGMWVKCSTANKARIGITDSAGTTWSSYHSGGGSYEWLEVTRTPAAGITSYNIVLDSGTSTEARFSQPQLQFGTSVGQGNFVPIHSEYISLEANITSQISGTSKSTSTGTLNLCADTLGKLPKFTKQVRIWTEAQEAATGSYYLMGSGSYKYDVPNMLNVASKIFDANGMCNVVNSDIYYSFLSSGTNTITAFSLRYTGVRL